MVIERLWIMDMNYGKYFALSSRWVELMLAQLPSWNQLLCRQPCGMWRRTLRILKQIIILFYGQHAQWTKFVFYPDVSELVFKTLQSAKDSLFFLRNIPFSRQFWFNYSQYRCYTYVDLSTHFLTRLGFVLLHVDMYLCRLPSHKN